MPLRPEGFTTYVVTWCHVEDANTGDLRPVQRRVWSYETTGPDSRSYHVSHANDGHIVYRRNGGAWMDYPQSGIHDDIVRHFAIIPGENNGDRLC